MSNFHIGQKVVCVSTKKARNVDGTCSLQEGKEYIVRWTGDYSGINGDGPHIRLAGVNRVLPGDTPYLSSRFRPVKTTDISIFAAMLAPTPRMKEPTA